MIAWLAEHPVSIPDAIRAQLDDWRLRGEEPALTEEGYYQLLKEQRELKEKTRDTEEAQWYRLGALYDLRDRGQLGGPAGLAGELQLLELELTPCYCGSGIRFKACHGMS